MFLNTEENGALNEVILRNSSLRNHNLQVPGTQRILRISKQKPVSKETENYLASQGCQIAIDLRQLSALLESSF